MFFFSLIFSLLLIFKTTKKLYSTSIFTFLSYIYEWVNKFLIAKKIIFILRRNRNKLFPLLKIAKFIIKINILFSCLQREEASNWILTYQQVRLIQTQDRLIGIVRENVILEYFVTAIRKVRINYSCHIN